MTRTATTLDRVAAFVLGAVLILLGLGLLVWNTDYIAGIPEIITAPGLVAAADTAWWPWALAGAGIIFVVAAVRWLFTHTPKARIKQMRLPGGHNGSISADLGAVAAAAAEILARDRDIYAASGRAVIDRGTRTIDLDVTAYSARTLGDITSPIDTVARQVAEVVGDPSVAVRTTIHVDKRAHRDHRVT